jgi:hypothetical protein
MRPVEIVVPEGSLLDAEFPKPTGGYTETILRMIDVVFSAMAQVAPERVVANAYGTINALSIAGQKSNGQRWVMFSLLRRRAWRQPRGDGLNHGNAPISMATIPPVEILEAAYPVIPAMGPAHRQRRHRRASRRARRGLRDRGAGGERRAGLLLRRTRPLRAEGRGGRRRRGGVNVFSFETGRGLGAAAARLEDGGHPAGAGPACAARNTRRRRLRPGSRPSRRDRSPATWPRAT